MKAIVGNHERYIRNSLKSTDSFGRSSENTPTNAFQQGVGHVGNNIQRQIMMFSVSSNVSVCFEGLTRVCP